jgi:hypothetical protein
MTPMPLLPTATRVWKHLPAHERLVATTAFFDEVPGELAGVALGALAKARNMRPQAARRLPLEAQARILSTVLEPGEPLAQGLLVALHLADRRPLLAAFLDALALPHEDGVLKEGSEGAPVTADQARAALQALSAFPREHVLTYLNTLWLQDPERWAALESAADEVTAAS